MKFFKHFVRASNDTFDKNKKISMSVLGLNSEERESTSNKANISNPKVNRGGALLTANRISADSVQISLGPSIPYIPLGVYHTGGFNAMLTPIGPKGFTLQHSIFTFHISSQIEAALNISENLKWLQFWPPDGFIPMVTQEVELLAKWAINCVIWKCFSVLCIKIT